MTAAFLSNSGSLLVSHACTRCGLRFAACSHSDTSDLLIAGTSCLSAATLARSRVVQWVWSSPTEAGSFWTSSSTPRRCEGGKSPGRVTLRLIHQAVHSELHEPLAPALHPDWSLANLTTDFRIRETLGHQKNSTSPDGHSETLRRETAKTNALVFGQLNNPRRRRAAGPSLSNDAHVRKLACDRTCRRNRYVSRWTRY